ncbi:MAG TPA: hypothetical protein DCZ55_15015 [Cyanobacteria bacterium UBA11371]|nr:hypothetical protein [Cyanobacteria bacterium UBA11371]
MKKSATFLAALLTALLPTSADAVQLFYGQVDDAVAEERAAFLITAGTVQWENFESVSLPFSINGGNRVSSQLNQYWQGNRFTIDFTSPITALAFDGLSVGAPAQNLLLSLDLIHGNNWQLAINVDADTTTDLFWGLVSNVPIQKVSFDQGDYAFGLDNVVWQPVTHPTFEPTSIPEPGGLAGLTLVGVALAFLYARPQ